jgi:hypothetical protein
MVDAEALSVERPLPLMERVGIWYLRSRPRPAPISPDDGTDDVVHVLDARERALLRRIERSAILRAAAAGALSTLVSAGAELVVLEHETSDPLLFWAVVGGATAVASLIEILYLYWDGLRAVHALSFAAGLELFPHGDAGRAVAGQMARAALELPNPPDPRWGVDPLREASRARLVFGSLLYKAKISVTNFAVKALLRRLFGRAAVRTWLPFVAVPVTAAWNGAVCWFILREARLRAMGASAAQEMIAALFADEPSTTAPQRVVTVRAVAATVVRTHDLHPNLVALLERVRRTVMAVDSDWTAPADLDDSQAFLSALAALPEAERRLPLRVLGVAAIIDGRMTGPERRLWDEARAAAGHPPETRALRALLRAFVRGDPVPLATLRALG